MRNQSTMSLFKLIPLFQKAYSTILSWIFPFPPTLIKLTVQYFTGSVKTIPCTLTQLVTDYDFNQPVDNLPPTLTHLTVGDNFNQPVDKLPPTLTHLTTGVLFNQPVDNLPPTLTHLTTIDGFGQPVLQLSLITRQAVTIKVKLTLTSYACSTC
jgi:FNIP Repeat